MPDHRRSGVRKPTRWSEWVEWPISSPGSCSWSARSVTTIDHLGPRGLAAGEASAPPRAGDAPADRPGGMVEL